MRKILIVEDNADSAEVLKDILAGEDYNCDVAPTGAEAEMLASTSSYDLILLDIMLPDKSGFELLDKFKNDPFTALTPVILLTALNDMDSRIKGYNLGCNDFVSKPYNHFELMARVRNHIRLKHALSDLEDTNNVLYTLAAAIEAKDPYTRGHSYRVGMYCWEIAGILGWSDAEKTKIKRAGLLHDIGKIGVPDYILIKDGKLTGAEYDAIKIHPVLSAEICSSLTKLKDVIPAIKYHHERFDGKGYPEGLAGGRIPYGARIMAVCDSWDAMTSNRAYRKKLKKAEVLEILKSGAGSQWDGDIVEIFIQIREKDVE
ncbi:MAG: two-component system response regulator [Elusimicrobia bacterium CG08_land_8_20_14_0_20_44_26]|nr:MAG: two-component system response regulator [Elusimicrobia bacterium CG08_land_8_20_14_0_20_44_26]